MMKAVSDVTVIPNTGLRDLIERETDTNTPFCWTCGACDGQCPVSICTGQLRPQKIVRMATYGMLEELLHEPTIWYCLGCRKCSQICPNVVRPAELIAHVRQRTLNESLYAYGTIRHYRVLFEHLQQVRKQAVIKSLKGEPAAISYHRWCDWRLSPSEESNAVPIMVPPTSSYDHPHVEASHALACFTCGECSSACPIACERSVFDPRSLFRMFNLGLMDELRHNRSIWLCLDCGRCSQACSQLVDGRGILRLIKQQAIDLGIVDYAFFARLEQANRFVLQRWIEEVDALFGFNGRDQLQQACENSSYAASCADYHA